LLLSTKLAKQLVELQLDEDDENAESRSVDYSKVNLDELLTVGQASMDPWLKKFKWNGGRWDYEKNSLQSITDDIVKTATVVDTSYRQKSQEWMTLNRSINSAKSLATGSVLMRDVSSLIKKDQIVDTESLCTILVVVPRTLLGDWKDSYEKIECEDLKQVMGESGSLLQGW